VVNIILSVLIAAVAPGLALLCYFYLKDRYHAEPIRIVGKMFVIGALLVLPAIVLQSALIPGTNETSFLFSFGISAGVEEFLKWFAVYFLIYKHAVFDEPYDGIVYAVTVSLGFATLENIFYAFLHHAGFSSLLYRAFLPVSGHALFGAAMGYYLGKAKFQPQRERLFLAMSILLPTVYHGVFNFILANVRSWFLGVLPFMVFLWFRTIFSMQRANAGSPYRALRPEEDRDSFPTRAAGG
jgi:RsiW-degrading membrane proteinase PrsW (M82 family)